MRRALWMFVAATVGAGLVLSALTAGMLGVVLFLAGVSVGWLGKP